MANNQKFRPSKDDYYLDVAKQISKRSTCMRAHIGAVIVRDDQIISTGYQGAPRKTKDCFERGFCLRTELKIPHGQRYELCRSVHAEMNAIINAARAGVSLLGGDIYIYGEKATTGEIFDVFPCFFCKRMIINAGLKRVIVRTKDNDINVFYVEDWVREWQEKDIIDDKMQYGAGMIPPSKEEINKKFGFEK